MLILAQFGTQCNGEGKSAFTAEIESKQMSLLRFHILTLIAAG